MKGGKTKMVEAYIESRYRNGKKDYTMYFHYHGTEGCYCKSLTPEANLGSVFTTKVHSDIEGATYANNETILYSVKNIANIAEAIMPITAACTNQDVQSDFNVYLNGNTYEIVKNEDDTNYHSFHIIKPDNMIAKGISFDILSELQTEISTLKDEVEKGQSGENTPNVFQKK